MQLEEYNLCIIKYFASISRLLVMESWCLVELLEQTCRF